MTEPLHVPEEFLLDVCRIIRAGLKAKNVRVPREVRTQLLKWCRESEQYMKRP